MSLGKAILEAFANKLEEIGESKLEEILQKVHDEDGAEEYKAAIYGGHVFVQKLKKFADKTKTKIDNAILDSIDESIHDSAAKNGIPLESH